MDEQAGIDQPEKTLSSDEYGNQFINDNPDVSINDVLKETIEVEIQSIVEVPVLQEKPADQRPPLVDTTKLERKVDAMLKNDHIEAIDKSVQAHLKNILPKHVPNHTIHIQHMKLYDALMDSLLVDEDDMDKQLDDQPSQTKRRHDNQDPPTDADKETKKRRRKDSDASSLKKSKDKKELMCRRVGVLYVFKF
ncbi:hypothetical protein Tco_1500126 [Tanacetum coccineum]